MEEAAKFVVALDAGSTSCRAIVFDAGGAQVASARQPLASRFPRSGWVEQDAVEIWNAQLTALQRAKAAAGIRTAQIAAVGIANQRETVVLWDKETGIPVYNAVSWQDKRAAEWCDGLVAAGWGDKVTAKTGLLLNPYFSAPKIQWLLQNVPAAKEKLAKGKLLAGTVDSWLIWKLTQGRVHATDVSNASRTLLFNIHEMKWDDELLELFGVPKQILPEVRPSGGDFGAVAPAMLSQRATFAAPICGVAGDQQASLFGQLCVRPGMVKNTYGTGCFALMNVGEKPIASSHGLLTTVAWQLGAQRPVYALEGSVFVAGAAVQWLRDGLRLIYDASETDFYCAIAEETAEQEVYVVPSFTGLGAPYWDTYSRGAVFGIDGGTRREHLIKATIEAIAFQTNDLLVAMAKDAGKPLETLKVDGGVSGSDYLMQFQASISGINVVRLKNREATALGAAYLAGMSAGI